MKDLSKLFKNVKILKSKMDEMQRELSQKTISVSTGGGMVTVVANGNQEIVSLEIDNIIFKENDKQMLQDLIISAVNEALKQTKDMITNEIGKVSTGVDPNFFKNIF